MIRHVLIPSRFLAIIAQLLPSILLFWTKDDNIKAGLPTDYSQSDFDDKDQTMLILLIVTMACFAFELFAFLRGYSIFSHSIGFFSILAHCAGAISLAFFIMQNWNYEAYYYISAFCVFLPCVIEIGNTIFLTAIKKTV